MTVVFIGQNKRDNRNQYILWQFHSIPKNWGSLELGLGLGLGHIREVH